MGLDRRAARLLWASLASAPLQCIQSCKAGGSQAGCRHNRSSSTAIRAVICPKSQSKMGTSSSGVQGAPHQCARARTVRLERSGDDGARRECHPRASGEHDPSFHLTPRISLRSAGSLASEHRPVHLGACTVTVPMHRGAWQLVRAV